MQENNYSIRHADTNGYIIGADSNLFAFDVNVYALLVQTKTFSVRFKAKPKMEIAVSGVKPEFSEFVNAFIEAGSFMPVSAIQVFYIAACVAFDAVDC